MAFDLKTALTGLAPTLAAMLGGPLAGTAVTALESAFGLTAGAGQDGITAAMQAGAMTPEIAANVRKADQEHAEKLKQMDIDLVKLNADHEAAAGVVEAGDRADARKRDSIFVQLGRHNWRADFLAYGAVAAFASCGYALFVMQIPTGNRDTLLMLLGALVIIVKDIYGFEFSTTRDSQTKTTALADIAKAP